MLVAHRAANSPTDVTAPWYGADALELDVHRFRRRLEVRHSKVLWPSAIRWDRWHIVPRATERVRFDEIVASAGADTHLWVDLKGFGSRLTDDVLVRVADRRQTTLSSRSWWILRRASRLPNVRTVHSIGSRYQLRAIRSRWLRGVDAVAIDQRFVDPAVLLDLRRVAAAVFVWGVVDADRAMTLIAGGVHGIIVDGPDLVMEIRSRIDELFPSQAPPQPLEHATVTRHHSGAVLTDMANDR
jgi:hypothetical protein